MHATSTPTLTQPKSNAPTAFIAAVALAVGIAAGSIAVVNLAAPAGTTAVSGPANGPTDVGLSLHRNGETGALTPGQRGLLLQRQGEIGADAATVSRSIPAIGGRDPMAHWNSFSLLGVSTQDALRAEGGWYAFEPATAPSATDDDNAKYVGPAHR